MSSGAETFYQIEQIRSCTSLNFIVELLQNMDAISLNDTESFSYESYGWKPIIEFLNYNFLRNIITCEKLTMKLIWQAIRKATNCSISGSDV